MEKTYKAEYIANHIESTIRSTGLLGFCLSVLAVLILSFPTFIGLNKIWQSNKAFDGLALVPIMSLLLINRFRHKFSKTLLNITCSDLPYLIVSIIAMLLFSNLAHYRISALGFILSIFFTFEVFWYKTFRPYYLRFLSFLILMIPIPTEVLKIITVLLQQFCVIAVEGFYGIILDQEFYRRGCDFYFNGCPQVIIIAEQCSGIQSMIGFIIMAAFFSFMDHLKPCLTLIMLFSSVLLSICLNLTRIIITIEMKTHGLAQYTTAKMHGLTGVIIFIIGCVILSKLSRFIRN